MKSKRSRFYSFFAALTLVLVFVTALNCGCAFAAETAEPAVTMDCHGEGDAAKATAGNNVCCSGCEITKQALTPTKTELQSTGLLSTNTPLTSFEVLPAPSNTEAFKANFKVRRNFAHAGSAPFHKQPLYLAVQVFLI